MSTFMILYKNLQNANIYYPENNAYFYLDFIENNYYDELELVYHDTVELSYYIYMILVLDGKLHLSEIVLSNIKKII